MQPPSKSARCKGASEARETARSAGLTVEDPLESDCVLGVLVVALVLLPDAEVFFEKGGSVKIKWKIK